MNFPASQSPKNIFQFPLELYLLPLFIATLYIEYVVSWKKRGPQKWLLRFI